MPKPVIAICYDFDKTLAQNDMQTFSFIPNLGLTIDEFWGKCGEFSKTTGTESTLSYLRIMIEECKKKNIKLTREYLNSLGKDVKFFEGVNTWFKRINQIAEEHGVEVEHYIISSGNKEIIEGSNIAKEFKQIYGCEFLYDEDGIAYWPKTIVNYTLKTQYLFRICKGVINSTDESKINQRIEKKHVEFRNMIYVGDGMTDVPAMTLVKEKGGFAISVYQQEHKNVSQVLIDENRVNYACKSDFKANSQLERLIRLIIESIALKEKLFEKENNQSL
ncbi:MAG: haloacid dehalogenase-like hydrolase [Bacillales bacterium]|nr:haloacid dehalogenase-like hydrolase [Bacillales bacterium]